MIHNFRVVVLLVAVWMLPVRDLASAADNTPSKELIEYVRGAKRLGLQDDEIRKNSVGAGWPAGTVDVAIAAVADTAKTEQKPTQARAEAPKKSASKKPETPKPAAAAAPAAADPAAPTASAAAEAAKSHGVPDDYRIGSGDVLQVQVWKEPDASVQSVVVRPDGRITLPLLKEMDVNGLTPTELEKIVAGRLAEFLTAPDVTVVVKEIHSKKIYLIGAVKKEGPIPFSYRMTVMQALSEGGGLTDYAKRKKIYVLRTQNGKEYRLLFDYEAALKGERMELNIPLMPGDTVVVPH